VTFTEVTFTDSASQLDRVTLLLKTVRNNLFHGGKHGSAYWDDPERIRLLLPLCITVLGELAEFGGMQADYTGQIYWLGWLCAQSFMSLPGSSRSMLRSKSVKMRI
jgi:hypothetical protein